MTFAADVILRLTNDGEVQITGWGWFLILSAALWVGRDR